LGGFSQTHLVTLFGKLKRKCIEGMNKWQNRRHLRFAVTTDIRATRLGEFSPIDMILSLENFIPFT
jgi:hypothetical protein